MATLKAEPITDAAIDAALAVGRALDEQEPHALSASYDPTDDRLVVELDNGYGMHIPRRWLQGLEHATPAQLQHVRILGPGTAIAWNDPDVGFTVEGLWNNVFGSRRWMSVLGRAGGAKTSERKAASSRANGLKGGRPKRSDMLLSGGGGKESGLDSRHRDQDGQIRLKRGDTLNKNLPEGRIPGFSPNARLDTMRDETGKTSIKDVPRAAKDKS